LKGHSVEDPDFAGQIAEMDSFVPQIHDPESVDGLRLTLSWWLIAVGRMWGKLLDQRLQSSSQTQPRWRALAWARMKPGISQQEMARRMQVSGPTLARILDGLEKKGLIVRRTDPRDRRLKEVYLDEKAHELVSEISLKVASVRDEVLGDISEEEMRSFLSTLSKIRKGLLAATK
jgi:MarR family transcriptional regulator for hemolysin